MTGAREARVEVAPGDIRRVCPACGTGEPHAPDGDPRCVVVGARLEMQQVTLKDGREIPAQVPVDVAYHFDCHAALGCDRCKELLDAHDGSVRGKAHPERGLPNVPEHLQTVEPGEFQVGDNAVLVRVATKEEAVRAREQADEENSVPYIPVEEAATLHARHSAEMQKG